jgi:O2-independent ubiquinone biosynthesis accessory factor UbiT
MIPDRSISHTQPFNSGGRRRIPRPRPPLPLFALQPLLRRIVRAVARRHPELFVRLGDSCNKRFLIDPSNLPFYLLLCPDAERPRLTAHSRRREIAHDVYISGTFLTLLRMIDSQIDSDALFFNRDLIVTGDSEAVVALRNALDDMDGTLADDVAASFGPFSRPVRSMFDLANKIVGTET